MLHCDRRQTPGLCTSKAAAENMCHVAKYLNCECPSDRVGWMPRGNSESVNSEPGQFRSEGLRFPSEQRLWGWKRVLSLRLSVCKPDSVMTIELIGTFFSPAVLAIWIYFNNLFPYPNMRSVASHVNQYLEDFSILNRPNPLEESWNNQVKAQIFQI